MPRRGGAFPLKMETKMSTESDQNRLTINDPVSKEVLQNFEELDDAHTRIALRLLQLENEKIQLLAAAKRNSEEQKRLFEKVLIERGLSPMTHASLDFDTGKLTLNKDQTPPTK